MIDIGKIPADSFTWSRWRGFNLFEEMRIRCRTCDIIRFRMVIKQYVVGYREADGLLCRPKKDHYAVMFLKDDIFSWCHLTKTEFFAILNWRQS